MPPQLRLADLLDLNALQKMGETHYKATGVPIGLIDAIDGSVLIGAGWSSICTHFHRINPLSLQRCQESDNYIKNHLVEGEACQYTCRNGLVDIGMPVIVAGHHLATLFIGQFFYEGEVPERDLFIRQAREFGFDQEAYLAALDQVPVYSREKVNYILDYDKSLVVFISSLAENTLSRQELDKQHLKLQKLESLGILAGGIAHDFNNILTGILGNISFAMTMIEPDHAAFRRLHDAEQASLRAAQLAQQLLTFAKGGEPVKKVVSAHKLVHESLTLMLSGSNVKGILDIPEDLHDIEADEGQLSQAFNNIILNAAHAMPDGGTLKVHAENVSMETGNHLGLEPGSYIKINFTDQGCGIPDDIQSRIFDPYFTTKTSGSGLGLASVHSIVLRHGGNISVSSVVGAGTTFTLYLPATTETVPAAPTLPAAKFSFAKKSERILVMEDEEIISELVKGILTLSGYDVESCTSGEEALAMFQQALTSGTPYSAVIMDLTIPGGMGGKETAEKMLALDPGACLIVSSGYSQDPVMADYRAYGFNAAITKPYDVREFIQLINNVLELQHEHTR